MKYGRGMPLRSPHLSDHGHVVDSQFAVMPLPGDSMPPRDAIPRGDAADTATVRTPRTCAPALRRAGPPEIQSCDVLLTSGISLRACPAAYRNKRGKSSLFFICFCGAQMRSNEIVFR